MRRDLLVYLWNIEQAVDDISAFFGDKTFEVYDRDKMLQTAIERKLILIGEALKKSKQHFSEEIDSLGFFNSLVGFQSFLTVEYLLSRTRLSRALCSYFPNCRRKLLRVELS